MVIQDIIFPKPVIGAMRNVKLRLDAKSENKLVWLDPDANAIKARLYDVDAKFYSNQVEFYILKAVLDARCTHAHLDMTIAIEQ